MPKNQNWTYPLEAPDTTGAIQMGPPDEAGMSPFRAFFRATSDADANTEEIVSSVTIPANSVIYAGHIKCTTAPTGGSSGIGIGSSTDAGATLSYLFAEFDEADLDAQNDEVHWYHAVETANAADTGTGGILIFVDSASTLCVWSTDGAEAIDTGSGFTAGSWDVVVYGYTFSSFPDA